MSERWVALTNVELEKGGAVELRFACGGTIECGSAFWRKEKAKNCVWGNGRAIYRVLEKFYFAFIFFIFGFRKGFFFFFVFIFIFNIVLM